MGQGDIDGRRLSLAFAFILLIFAVGAVIFACVQNVWIDETTQLSGMTLMPAQLVGWLSGSIDIPFGVPADRMPPVSYFVDMITWHVTAGNVLAIRLIHAAITAGGILMLMIAMARRFGGRAALIAGLILALSPKLIDIAVEIRAYPLFFTLSCAQVALLVSGNVAARPGRLVLFLLLGLLSGYTHFFGVVATSAFFLALFIDAPSWRTAIRACAGYALLLLLWTGLAPFVSGASSITAADVPPPSPGLGDLFVFAVRLIGSSPLLTSPATAIVFFVGTGLLALLGAIGFATLLARKGLSARHDPAVGLLLALLAGLFVVVAASFVLSGFNSLSPRYNIWMLPPCAVLLALIADGLLAPQGKVARIVRAGAVGIFAIGVVWSQANFLKDAGLFIHGPSQTLEAMLDRAGPNSAVVHVGPHWAWGYFPLYWRHRDAVPQWLLMPDGLSVARMRNGRQHDDPQPLSALAPYRALLVDRIEVKDYRDLQEMIARGSTTSRPLSLELAPTIAQSGWRGDEALAKPGYYDLTGQVYRKRAVLPESHEQRDPRD